MTELIIVIVAVLWSGMMYIIGVENGEAKFINGYKKRHPEIKHFEKIHFAGVTSDGRKFVYCPVGSIVSWSSGEIKRITDRNRRNFEDIMKRHAPEYGGLDIKEVERTVDRLPRKIYYNGKVLELKYHYMGILDDRWILSYGTDDPKDCFIHRDESTLEACVLGAWRNLALKKHEWDEVIKEDK